MSFIWYNARNITETIHFHFWDYIDISWVLLSQLISLATYIYFARNSGEGVLVNFPFTLGLVSIKEILVLKGFGKAEFITNL